MLKIIPGATGYFNKTLNSNQFDNEDAIKDKLDNRGSIKGKLNNIYGKSIDYAALPSGYNYCKNRFVYSTNHA